MKVRSKIPDHGMTPFNQGIVLSLTTIRYRPVNFFNLPYEYDDGDAGLWMY